MSETDSSEREQRLCSIFKAESKERLRTISINITHLKETAEPDDRRKTLDLLYREAHSLKGAARTANCSQIESISRAIENTFYALIRRSEAPSEDVMQALENGLELASTVSTAATAAGHEEEIHLIVQKLEAFAKGLLHLPDKDHA